MREDIGSPLLQALAEAATKHLGAEHALSVACRAGDLTSARLLLDRLDPQDADALLAAAHKHMREDPAALLAQWRPGRPPAH